MYNDPSGEFFIPLIFIASYAIVNLTVDLIKNNFNMNIGQIFGSLGRGALQGTIAYIHASLGLPFPSLIQTAILSNIPTPSLDFKLGSWNFSLSLSLNFGQGLGIGLNASIGYDDGHFSASMGFGITGWGHHFATGKSGFESRFSAMTGYRGRDFGLSLGTNFWGGGVTDQTPQRTGVIGISSGDFKLMYENDGGAGIKHLGLGDKGDSYRTAALNLGIGDYSIGFNLFTGRRNRKDQKGESKIELITKRGRTIEVNPTYSPQLMDKEYRKFKHGFVNEFGTKYRLGALYFGYKNYRIGTNSEHVRHAIQNRFIHNLIGDRGFENQSWDWKPYFQYRTQNQFTTW